MHVYSCQCSEHDACNRLLLAVPDVEVRHTPGSPTICMGGISFHPLVGKPCAPFIFLDNKNFKNCSTMLVNLWDDSVFGKLKGDVRC